MGAGSHQREIRVGLTGETASPGSGIAIGAGPVRLVQRGPPGERLGTGMVRYVRAGFWVRGMTVDRTRSGRPAGSTCTSVYPPPIAWQAHVT